MASTDQAITKTFDLLKQYRREKGCSKVFISILSLAIKNISAVTKPQTFVILGLPAFCSADSQSKETIKVEQRPAVSPRHAPLLPSWAAIYIKHNNTYFTIRNKLG